MMYIYVRMFMYKSTKMYGTTRGREPDVGKINKQTDLFHSVYILYAFGWFLSRTTCRLGFCLLYTFNAVAPGMCDQRITLHIPGIYRGDTDKK